MISLFSYWFFRSSFSFSATFSLLLSSLLGGPCLRRLAHVQPIAIAIRPMSSHHLATARLLSGRFPIAIRLLSGQSPLPFGHCLTIIRLLFGHYYSVATRPLFNHRCSAASLYPSQQHLWYVGQPTSTIQRSPPMSSSFLINITKISSFRCSWKALCMIINTFREYHFSCTYCWGRGRQCRSASNILVMKNLCKSRNKIHKERERERDRHRHKVVMEGQPP